MSSHRPCGFHDHDLVSFRLTPVDGYRIPYTFVEALNEGALFERPGRVFETAARSGCLYEVVVGTDQRIVGTGMFQETFLEVDFSAVVPADFLRAAVERIEGEQRGGAGA